MDRVRDTIVGTRGFQAPPDAEGVAEIAYFTFPSFEGQGCASAMAAGLVERGEQGGGGVPAESSYVAGTRCLNRILENVGFEPRGEIIDPEDGVIWRWEREPLSGSST